MDFQNLKPFIRNKYLVILVMLLVLAILLPSFVVKDQLGPCFVGVGLLALVVFGLYQNIRFQKLHKKLRPFVVTRIAQVITAIVSVGIFIKSFMRFMEAPAHVPYIIFWLLIIILNYQFYSIFHIAKQAKKDFPDRCEFC